MDITEETYYSNKLEVLKEKDSFVYRDLIYSTNTANLATLLNTAKWYVHIDLVSEMTVKVWDVLLTKLTFLEIKGLDCEFFPAQQLSKENRQAKTAGELLEFILVKSVTTGKYPLDAYDILDLITNTLINKYEQDYLD